MYREHFERAEQLSIFAWRWDTGANTILIQVLPTLHSWLFFTLFFVRRLHRILRVGQLSTWLIGNWWIKKNDIQVEIEQYVYHISVAGVLCSLVTQSQSLSLCCGIGTRYIHWYANYYGKEFTTYIKRRRNFVFDITCTSSNFCWTISTLSLCFLWTLYFKSPLNIFMSLSTVHVKYCFGRTGRIYDDRYSST